MGGLIEKQSIRAMAVEDGSETVAEGSYRVRMYIAASGQLYPIGSKTRLKLT